MSEIILEAINLHAGYGDHKVLKNILLLIQEHQFIGIIGPNGSGKSTLMQVLARSLSPRSGMILFVVINSIRFLSGNLDRVSGL